MQRQIYLIAVLAAFLSTGCKKYAELTPIAHPAYIRVFNDLPATKTALNNGQALPFLTFIMDPQMDASGAPTGGAIVGDYMATRQLFSLSYPINEANGLVGNTLTEGIGSQPITYLNPISYEYPGNAHVVAAPAINGFDLSAWAQVPSGRHRIVFVTRPENATAFGNLSGTIRSQVLIDTTVDLAEGEVYTLEAVSRDMSKPDYGLYFRHEAFPHESFEDNKLYVGFVNLSEKPSQLVLDGFAPAFPEKTAISYTYNIQDDNTSDFRYHYYRPLPGYDNINYTTLVTKMDTAIPYLALPLLPRSYFFLADTLRTYAAAPIGGTTLIGQGSLPNVVFTFQDANNPGTPFLQLYCGQDPATFNNLDPLGTYASSTEPNLNLIVNINGQYQIYPTLNIMEMVDDRVYMMQIQKAFNTLSKQ
jgi:hypothetical protein